MNNLYFTYNTIKAINIKKNIEEYIPLSIKFKYDRYSNTHSWAEYQTQDHFMDFKFGNELGELISISLVRHKNYNVINSNLKLDQYPYCETTIGINISSTDQLSKKPYLDGFYYTITKSCIVDVYNDAIKITMQQAPMPTKCIMNNNFGILTDNDLNVCAFVFKEITPAEHMYLIGHTKEKYT